MEDIGAYTRQDLKRAVNASAVLGWFAVSAPSIWVNPFALPWVAFFGLPIAFAACWVIGAPILKRVMRKPVTWLKAAIWGGSIASIIAAISIMIGRYQGWRVSQNPNFSSRVGGDGFIRSIDGILTPYGWWVLAQNTALFVLAGVVIALIVRGVIGAGRTSSMSATPSRF